MCTTSEWHCRMSNDSHVSSRLKTPDNEAKTCFCRKICSSRKFCNLSVQASSDFVTKIQSWVGLKRNPLLSHSHFWQWFIYWEYIYIYTHQLSILYYMNVVGHITLVGVIFVAYYFLKGIYNFKSFGATSKTESLQWVPFTLINCVQRKQWNELQVKPFPQKQPFTEGVETSVYLFKNRHNFPVQWQSDLLEIFTLHGNLCSIFTKMVIFGLF